MIAAAFSAGRRRQQKIMKNKFWLDDRDRREDILYEVSARAVAMQGQSGREVLPGDIGRHTCFIDTCSPSVGYHSPTEHRERLTSPRQLGRRNPTPYNVI